MSIKLPEIPSISAHPAVVSAQTAHDAAVAEHSRIQNQRLPLHKQLNLVGESSPDDLRAEFGRRKTPQATADLYLKLVADEGAALKVRRKTGQAFDEARSVAVSALSAQFADQLTATLSSTLAVLQNVTVDVEAIRDLHKRAVDSGLSLRTLVIPATSNWQYQG